MQTPFRTVVLRCLAVVTIILLLAVTIATIDTMTANLIMNRTVAVVDGLYTALDHFRRPPCHSSNTLSIVAVLQDEIIRIATSTITASIRL
jgi:hypothetical protein